MAISIFPSTAAEFVSNNFVVDMNDSTNNTADTGGVKQAGPYSMSFSSGDSSFDVYFVDEEGNSVGYSNTTSIVATGLFTTVVIFGVAQDEVISFQYQGSVNNADGEGDEPGAGAYLESISPTDLPSIDDTATVTGGNFGTNTVFTFESGATVLQAKNASIVSGTEALITRPDGLIEDDAPYDLKVVNPGVPTPTAKDFVLTDTVTAGSDPTWVTGPQLQNASKDSSFSQTLEATDAEGTVVGYSVTAGTITPGLTLDSLTGVISGTPTDGGEFVFTVTATDDGGNTSDREFTQAVQSDTFEFAQGGTVTTDGNYQYHTFTSTDDFEALASFNAEILIIAGGGGSPTANTQQFRTGGSGAGGLVVLEQVISQGIYTATIGGGGSYGNGSNSSLGNIFTTTGGGMGGIPNGQNGGSGGGNGVEDQNGDPPADSAGEGIAGQGNDGGQGVGANEAAGGGGKGEVGGQIGAGGQGINLTEWASATSTGDNGFYAGGGAGGGSEKEGGDGGGGFAGSSNPSNGIPSTAGLANTGGGGAGGEYSGFSGGGINNAGTQGGSGLVIVRYTF